MRIDLFVLDGVFDTGLAALHDTLLLAQDLARENAAPLPGGELQVRRIGIAESASTAAGLIAPTRKAQEIEPPDVVIVPAVGATSREAVEHILTRQDVNEAGALLRQWHAAGTTVAAACTGTFVLAEARLLDGLPATTSWWLTDCFRVRYPRVRLVEKCMVLDAGAVITAGAALAHFDLALSLIRRSSRTLASAVARYLSIEDLRSTHAAFAMPDHVRNHDPVVERFESWAHDNLAAGFSLSRAAQAVGTSPRTLTRKLRSTLGKSPLEAFQDARMARALFLLKMTKTNVEEIAAEVGYADSVSLRLLVRRKLGRSISELRKSGPAQPKPARE